MPDEKSSIDLTKDGPLIVNNLKILENSRGEVIECNNKFALCRCGSSNNKPFCDGSHKKVGFSGDRESRLNLSREKEYEGKDISVFYNAGLCYHAEACVKNLPLVFDPKARPWINPNASDNQAIIKTVSKCPSGALSYKIADKHIREFNHDVKIRIDKNGPYQVRGPVELNVDKDIEPMAKDHYALCRCGASGNKPYCDGSHSKSGFVDDKN